MSLLNHTLTALLFSVVTLLSFPLSAAQPPHEDWYKRIYTGLDRETLYNVVGKVFESEGYQVPPIAPQGVAVASLWKESDQPAKNLYERTRLRSHFRDPNPSRQKVVTNTDSKNYLMIFDLVKEVRANKNEEWRNQGIDFYNDSNYMRIFKKIDDAVTAAGGKVTLLPPPAPDKP